MRATCLSLAVVCAWAAFAPARDIYVDNAEGYDGRNGSRPHTEAGVDGPVATIAKALRLAAAGDRIIVAATDQPYRESVSLVGSRHSASIVAPLVIEGSGATLDGSAPVPPDAWKHHLGDVFYFQPARLTYQQLFLKGQPANRRPTTAAAVTLPPLEPLEWCLADGRIYFRVEQGHLPMDYDPACCVLQTGITFYHVAGVIVRDLVIQGFANDGACAHDAWGGVAMERLTCRANGRAGIAVMGASRVEVDGCELAGNGAAQLHLEGPSITAVHDSKLADDTAAPLVQRDGSRLTVDGKQRE